MVGTDHKSTIYFIGITICLAFLSCTPRPLLRLDNVRITLSRAGLRRPDVAVWYLIILHGSGDASIQGSLVDDSVFRSSPTVIGGTDDSLERGAHPFHVSQEVVNSLVERCQDIDFYNMRDSYPENGKGGPIAQLYLRYAGKEKSVEWYFDEWRSLEDRDEELQLSELDKLARIIDSLAGTARFIKKD